MVQALSNMQFLDNPDRLLLIQRSNRVSSLAEVEAALTALRGWRKLYPGDWGIWDAGEELFLLRDAYSEDGLCRLFRTLVAL